jgi:hypothetical protein
MGERTGHLTVIHRSGNRAAGSLRDDELGARAARSYREAEQAMEEWRRFLGRCERTARRHPRCNSKVGAGHGSRQVRS